MTRDHISGTTADGSDDEPTTAILFPGQGSQRPGMGKAFFEAWPETNHRYRTCSRAIDIDVVSLCFDGDEETLASTENTQPCVYTTGVATYAGLADRYALSPAYVAGHSLGHFSALTAADCLAPEEGVELVRKRGKHMERAAKEGDEGTMVAVLTREPGAVDAVCRRVDGASVAAQNSASQVVVSGSTRAVDTVCDLLEDQCRARCVELDVGGAFHSELMRPAMPFVDDLAAIDFDAAAHPIVSDVTGETYRGGGDTIDELGEQLLSPVRWKSVIETLRENGVERFVELPPAGTLTKFTQSLCPDATTVALRTPADAEEVFGA